MVTLVGALDLVVNIQDAKTHEPTHLNFKSSQ